MANPRTLTYTVLCILAGILLAGLYVVLPMFQAFFVLPMINDITTDLADPPAFVASSHPAPPPEFADKQSAAYPDLGPVTLPLESEAAFDAARAAAIAMDWVIRGEDRDSGRIEAVATTPVMRFKDDIAIRLRPEGDGTRVDIRSRSRAGRHDFGANAERIRAFLAKLRE
jgi:uncharacterized protein (DUF1499 family)